MTYLKKDQRQHEILKAAMRVAIQDGIAAITARRIAQEAQMAVGQIHHHFTSVGQLKAQTLLTIIKQFIETAEQDNQKHATTFEQLVYLMTPFEGEAGLITRRLWSEAIFLAERDSAIKHAYQTSMEDWYQATINLLEQGIRTKEFILKDPQATAWRLIALSCGLDAISVIEEFTLNNSLIKNYIVQALQQEITIL